MKRTFFFLLLLARALFRPARAQSFDLASATSAQAFDQEDDITVLTAQRAALA
jgi:hypothetical protein